MTQRSAYGHSLLPPPSSNPSNTPLHIPAARPNTQHRILDVQRGAVKTGRPQPFALLLPAWTSKWLPWRTFLWALARLRKGALEVPDAPRLAIHALLTFIPQSDFDG
jgi:hypothetical protein